VHLIVEVRGVWDESSHSNVCLNRCSPFLAIMRRKNRSHCYSPPDGFLQFPGRVMSRLFDRGVSFFHNRFCAPPFFWFVSDSLSDRRILFCLVLFPSPSPCRLLYAFRPFNDFIREFQAEIYGDAVSKLFRDFQFVCSLKRGRLKGNHIRFFVQKYCFVSPFPHFLVSRRSVV